MLSNKLVQTIEEHCEVIMSSLISRIRLDPELQHMAKLPTWELRDWGCGILKNLGKWLSAGRERTMAERYEGLGRLRFQESIPLSEAVYALQLLKDKAIVFVKNGGFVSQSAFEAFAEEELEYLVGRFFDRLVYYLIRGYEEAQRDATRLTLDTR